MERYDNAGQLAVKGVAQSNVNGLASALVGKADSNHSHTLQGDVNGAVEATTVTALRGRPVGTASPSSSQVSQWNGAEWTPGTVVSGAAGTIAVVSGGTGTTTFTSNGVLVGAGSAPVGTVAPGAQYSILAAGAGGAPSFGAVSLNQPTAVTGVLALTNGGTGETTASGVRTALGLRTSALTSTGTTAGSVVQLDGTAKLPAVDGSLVTNIRGANPVGTIPAFGGTAAPTGYLLRDGGSLLRTSYTALFAVIGTSFGAIDATHFSLPDFRGKFLRGTDGAVGNDPGRTSRAACGTRGNTGDQVGSCQADGTAVNGLAVATAPFTPTGSISAPNTEVVEQNPAGGTPAGYSTGGYQADIRVRGPANGGGTLACR